MSKRRIADHGEEIFFKRKELMIKGVVEMVREKSVMVRIPLEQSVLLGYENNLTVVSHAKYKIVEKVRAV